MTQARSSASRTEQSAELERLGGASGVFDLYALQNILIVHWSGSATAESLAVLGELSAVCRTRFPERTSVVHLLSAAPTSLPDAAARKAFTHVNVTYAQMVVCCVVVIRGTGFVASALRGVVTALILAAALELPVKIVNSVQEAAAWLTPLHEEGTGAIITAEQLSAQLELLCAQPP